MDERRSVASKEGTRLRILARHRATQRVTDARPEEYRQAFLLELEEATAEVAVTGSSTRPRVLARGRAKQRLIDRHREEFERHLIAERAALGLDPEPLDFMRRLGPRRQRVAS